MSLSTSAMRVGLRGWVPVSSSPLIIRRVTNPVSKSYSRSDGGSLRTQLYDCHGVKRKLTHTKIIMRHLSSLPPPSSVAPPPPQASTIILSVDGSEVSRTSNTSTNGENPLIMDKFNVRKDHGGSQSQHLQLGHVKILKVREKTINQRNIGEMNGYKYRLLATPLLTNNVIALPVQTIDELSPSSDIQATSNLSEKDLFDVRLLQQQYAIDVGRESSNHNVATRIIDLPSLSWLRRLFNDLGISSTESYLPQNTQPISQMSMRSRRSSSIALEEMMNSDSYIGTLPDERQNLDEEEVISDRIRVRSVQAASSIDVVAVLSKVFGGGVARTSQYAVQHPLSDFFASSPPVRHVFGRTNIIIQLSPPPTNGHPSLSHSVPRYIAIYRFGAVVFFNLTTKEASRVLDQVKKHSVNPISTGFERREHFEVALQPQLDTATGKITADRAMVRELDMNTVGIVSNIMGQTVALDWHNDTVDELLTKFSNVNSSVEKTGSFTSIERNTLFQVVARNNALFIDMVGKLGIKDRSDTAWHLSQYEGLHEGMRKEFELDERFRNVEFKLDLIQQNAKFFLEVMHAQKSNALEWVIIVLISFECGLMILDMSGWGKELLSMWPFV